MIPLRVTRHDGAPDCPTCGGLTGDPEARHEPDALSVIEILAAPGSGHRLFATVLVGAPCFGVVGRGMPLRSPEDLRERARLLRGES